jgi:hypothetical protein
MNKQTHRNPGRERPIKLPTGKFEDVMKAVLQVPAPKKAKGKPAK